MKALVTHHTDDARRSILDLALLITFSLLAAVAARAFNQDVLLYHTYALRLLHGSAEGHLPVEYPAAAALVFAAPLLLHLPYVLGFALLMTAALVTLAIAGLRLGGDAAWLRRTVLYLALGTATVLFGRYDLVPTLATFLAVMFARQRRWGPAWLAASIGGALKLFPFLLLPGFLLVEWRERGALPWRRVAATTIVLAAIGGLQSVFAPGSLLTPFRYEWRRGFELSSVGGSITALADPLHLRWHYAFGNWQIFGSGHAAIQDLLGLVAVLGIGVVWVLAWRRRLRVEAMSLAVLSVAVLTDRALAPQYLIWLAPLWSLWPRQRLWVAAAALTTLTFPVGYAFASPSGQHFLLATVMGLLRNAALVAGTCTWLVGQLNSTRQPAVNEHGDSKQPRPAAASLTAPPAVRPLSAGCRPGMTLARSIEGGATSPSDGG